jgi:hypothetical protein
LPGLDLPSGHIQAVRASPNFHGKPWYDYVAVPGEDNRADPYQFHVGHLKLLFRWGKYKVRC